MSADCGKGGKAGVFGSNFGEISPIFDSSLRKGAIMAREALCH